MLDLAVIILTKNEESNIKKCIDSFLGAAKEFIIVDSFSNDSTIQIVDQIQKDSNLKINIYKHEFINQAEQFNWAIENCNISASWLMRIDADEEMTPELIEELEIKLNNLDDDYNGIILKRRLIFLGKWIRHGGKYPEYLLRIFRKNTGYCEHAVMDEHLVLKNGRTVTFENDLIDNNTKSIEWWISKHNWYSGRERENYVLIKDNELNGNLNLQAKIRRFFKNNLYYRLPIFIRAHLYFIYRYYFRLGFLDGKEGKIYHFLQAYWYRFLVDAKIYELHKKNKYKRKQDE